MIMKTADASGKTLEEAKAAALAQLGENEQDVTFTILEEGKNAFLGLFGGKLYRVTATVNDTPERRAKEFLGEITRMIGAPAEVSVSKGENLSINLSGKHMGMLIGHRGETLDALQYLTSVVVNKGSNDPVRVMLDTENYRARREETLIRLGAKMAAKARNTHRRVVLEPMNPYERRILHASLQANPYVDTHSEGEEPNRRVVIVPR
mgnify:CR=1 FL=1